jgi:hypothetical protein
MASAELSPKEQEVWEGRYRCCDRMASSRDIVFVFPSAQFQKPPSKTIEALQGMYDHLKAATGVDPTQDFKSRCVVGYRHPIDEGGEDCCPGWGDHWVNVPWSYLKKVDQPEECCTHELSHPFVELLIAKPDEKLWTEGLCDFLRIGVFAAIGLKPEVCKRTAEYCAAANNEGDRYHDPAGRLLKAMLRQGFDPCQAKDVGIFLKSVLPQGLTTLFGCVPTDAPSPPVG